MLQDVIRLRQLSVVKVTERGDVCPYAFSCPFLQLNQQFSVFPYSQTGETAVSPTLYSANNRALLWIGNGL